MCIKSFLSFNISKGDIPMGWGPLWRMSHSSICFPVKRSRDGSLPSSGLLILKSSYLTSNRCVLDFTTVSHSSVNIYSHFPEKYEKKTSRHFQRCISEKVRVCNNGRKTSISLTNQNTTKSQCMCVTTTYFECDYYLTHSKLTILPNTLIKNKKKVKWETYSKKCWWEWKKVECSMEWVGIGTIEVEAQLFLEKLIGKKLLTNSNWGL